MDLMLRSADAVQKVMGSQSLCTKRGIGLFDALTINGEHSVEAILDTDEHRWRKQVWDRAMSNRGMFILGWLKLLLEYSTDSPELGWLLTFEISLDYL
jgi:hypothetical protein